jgi:hypothetical protein
MKSARHKVTRADLDGVCYSGEKEKMGKIA